VTTDASRRLSDNRNSVIAGKYRHIKLPVADSLGSNAEAVVARLNRKFNPDDFHVSIGGHNLDVWLRQMDVAELAAEVDAVCRDFDDAHAMQEVVKAVLGIRSYGLNGNKRLYVGYDRERKVADRKAKERRRGKYFYAADHDFRQPSNAFPDKYTNRVVCGDSELVLKELPDNCVDLVFTSPPYNFGLKYQESEDAHDWEAYFDKLFRVFDECIRVLRYGGRIAVNIQPLFSDYIPSHHIISNYFMKRCLLWKGEVLWEKNNYNCKYTAWGSWKSPASPYLKYTWEFVEIFCKGTLKKPGLAADADIDAESFKEWVNAKWSIAPERRMKEFGHPAMFPEELARRVLLLFSFQGDVVLDPFAGTGTTCVAASRTGRRFLGVDVSPEYCATAERRLGNVQTELPLRVAAEG